MVSAGMTCPAAGSRGGWINAPMLPLCGTWTADGLAAVMWSPVDGSAPAHPAELLAGRCGRCRSRVLLDASPAAVEMTRDRIAATQQATAKAAGDGR